MRASIIGRAVAFGAALVAFGLAATGSATAQSWPSGKTITLIVPYAAGTGADFAGRVLAEGLSKQLGQQVMVENRAGAGATIGSNAFSKAAPDGYTFMMTGASPVVNAPLLYKNLSYDPSKFVPVGMVMASPIMVIVHSDVPAKNLKELVAYAKANPGKINAGETGNGSTHQLLKLMFEKTAGVDLNLVSYKASPMMDLVAGRIQMMMDYPGAYMPHVKEGKLRILSNLHSSRHAEFADVPTMVEAGLPEYPAWIGWFAVYAPAGTPADIATKMNKALNEFLKTPEAAQKFATLNYVPTPSTPEDVKKKTDHETIFISRAIKDNNISLD